MGVEATANGRNANLTEPWKAPRGADFNATYDGNPVTDQ
jgi:hypothetical protein